MSEKLQFKFRNDQLVDIELIIEPWAQMEVITSGSVVEFEVNAEPPPEIDFAITENSRPYVYVMSESVTIRIDGITKHNFKTGARPPKAVFDVLQKKLWPS